MKHYDYVEWLLYKNKALPIEMLEEMEDHLYSCHICMDIFLSLIDEEEIEKAGESVPYNFTVNVINNISKTKVKKIEPRATKRVFNIQFGYYAAVASVTIVLTLGGFYTNLVDAVPKLTASIEITEERPNLIANFSNSIINTTSSFLFNIENIERNKEEK